MPFGGFGKEGALEYVVLEYVVSVSEAASCLGIDCCCLDGTSKKVGNPPGIEGITSLGLLEARSELPSIYGVCVMSIICRILAGFG